MNNYWFLYNSSDGSIYGAPYLGNAGEWTSIPTGCAVLGPFDETTANATVKDAYLHPDYYLVQLEEIVAKANILDLRLADAKQAKISQVTQAYQSELNGTFTSSATGAALVYDYSPTSQGLWKELLDAVKDGDLPDSSFPMNITLANETTAPHTQAQLLQIRGELTARKFSLYSKLQGMITAKGNILSATTMDAVNVIAW